MFDLVIRNGKIVDGQKTARHRGDVAVRGDRIAAVGHLPHAEANCVIDAKGKIVAPGFIDVHNHSDGWLLKLPHLSPKTLQGYTTEILMADGISYAPVNEYTEHEWLYYLRALDGLTASDQQGWRTLEDYMNLIDGSTVQNAATHIPYANVRSLVCGFGSRPVDDFQMRQIQDEITRGLDMGAVGLSTGLDYIVQCFATTDELVEACSVMARRRGAYVTHVRYKKGLGPALKEAVEIGIRADVPVHISHLKSQSADGAEEVFDYLDNARNEVELSFDVYPYQPGSTMLNYLLPYEVWENGPTAALEKLQHPRTRSRFRDGLRAYRLDLDHIRLAWVASSKNAHHVGKTLSRYIDDIGLPAEEALLNLLADESMAVLCVMDEGDDALVLPFLQHDLCMIGTDGIYFPDSCIHPRVYGSVGRVLGECVRDHHLFTVEEAVYKLSGFAAKRFGLQGRGVIREGCCADLVVFDPDTIRDHATFEQPHRPTTGICHVIVNGTAVITDGKPCGDLTDPLPGRFVRASLHESPLH